MPSRGPYWKEGGIPDFTIQESDLVQELQDKVNEGGHVIEDEGTPLAQQSNLNFVGAGVTATDSGGKTTVTIPGGGGGGGSGSSGWISTRLFPSVAAGFQESYDAMFVQPELSGEAASVGSIMPRDGKIESIRANVFALQSTASTNTVVQIRKNGTIVMTLSFDGAGTTGLKEEITPVSFLKNDLIDVLVTVGTGTGSLNFTPVIEYSFDNGAGGGGFDKKLIGDFSEWYVYDEMVHPTRAGVLVHWENRASLTDTFTVPVARGGVVTYGTGTTSGVNGTNVTTCAGGGAGIAIGGDYLYRTRIKLNTINDLLFWAGGMDNQFPEINDRTTVALAELGAVVNGLFFRYEGGTDTNFQCVTESADTQTIVDSGVVVDTAYHEFEIDCDGINAIFKIDGNQVANITTNIPTGINLICGNQINSLATGPSNNRTYDIDMMFIFSTTRT